ncbi:MAG: hypothetical protein K8U57_35255 [Planctomycetes bacterium]|nr:hypothetical protein [Planctomycetota bacterium]
MGNDFSGGVRGATQPGRELPVLPEEIVRERVGARKLAAGRKADQLGASFNCGPSEEVHVVQVPGVVKRHPGVPSGIRAEPDHHFEYFAGVTVLGNNGPTPQVVEDEVSVRGRSLEGFAGPLDQVSVENLRSVL